MIFKILHNRTKRKCKRTENKICRNIFLNPLSGPTLGLSMWRVIISEFFLINCVVCANIIAQAVWPGFNIFLFHPSISLTELWCSSEIIRAGRVGRTDSSRLSLHPNCAAPQSLSPPSQGRPVPPLKDSFRQNVGQFWSNSEPHHGLHCLLSPPPDGRQSRYKYRRGGGGPFHFQLDFSYFSLCLSAFSILFNLYKCWKPSKDNLLMSHYFNLPLHTTSGLLASFLHSSWRKKVFKTSWSLHFIPDVFSSYLKCV